MDKVRFVSRCKRGMLMSSQLTDGAVKLALYVILLAFEVFALLRLRRATRHGDEKHSMLEL